LGRSAIYEGWVMHRRLRPKVHRFKYRVFSLLIDLDELPRLAQLRLFGWNRRGLFSFFDRDHGPSFHEKGSGLRLWLDGLLAGAGIAPGGAKRVLCYPRILGHVFNPLSVWFCDDETGALKAIIYEVHNTYDEGHAYVFPVTADDVVRHGCAKDFYVSPFLSKGCRYHFRITPPGPTAAVTIHETQDGQAILNASFAGTRRDLTDAALLRLFLRYPLMTLKVVAAIHFEAVRLMLKGIRRHPHAPLAEPGTFSRNPR
jgi:DUF1365 family protein